MQLNKVIHLDAFFSLNGILDLVGATAGLTRRSIYMAAATARLSPF